MYYTFKSNVCLIKIVEHTFYSQSTYQARMESHVWLGFDVVSREIDAVEK